MGLSASASTADAKKGASDNIVKTASSAYAGGSSEKPTKLYVQAALSLFVPTFGFFGVRDFVRNRKEEKNVKFGIEVMDMKREEMFGVDKHGNNVTKTEDDDDDEDDDDSDKDDDKDDDDDDDDE